MPQLKILNNKEIKEILKLIELQWGAKLKLSFAFLRNQKNRVFIVSRDLSKIDALRLRINSVGMYFCEIDDKGIRLSIEGTQIVCPKAKKNVVELDEEETGKWLKGEDLEKECKGCSGFVILKYKNQKNKHKKNSLKDFDSLGCGRYSNGKLLNYVGKSRRVNIQRRKIIINCLCSSDLGYTPVRP